MFNVSAIRGINDGNVRCLSIDPGSNMLGLSILELNMNDGVISIIRAETVKARDIIAPFIDLVDILGERFCRNMAYREYISKLLWKWKVDFVVCESAYAGRFIAAFISLTEHVTLLKAAVFNYSRRMTFLMIEPSVVKKAMGVKGNSGNKDLMANALLSRNDIIACDTIEIDSLDEHAVDSCCIGLVTLERIRENCEISLDG